MNLNILFLQYIKNITLETYNQYKIISNRDLPGGPVAKSQFRRPRFDSWLGNKIPYATTERSCMPQFKKKKKSPHAATKTQHSQINRFFFNY